MMQGRRLVLYDETCLNDLWWKFGLTHSWIAGVMLYQLRGVIDDAKGVTSWAQGLRWLANQTEPIEQIQFWGHGKWGCAYVGQEILNVNALHEGHELYDLMCEIRSNMTPQSSWWFRTCETFGGCAGHDFAQQWSDFFNCNVAGHTFIIGPLQSGLRTLMVGQQPAWSVSEGIIEGTPEQPTRAAESHPKHANTITCLRSKIPTSWW